mgnify:CR=1 FL=1
MRKFLCWLGWHEYMDLCRDYETMGQSATQECIHCAKHEYVLRPFWSKEGPMHPRVQK